MKIFRKCVILTAILAFFISSAWALPVSTPKPVSTATPASCPFPPKCEDRCPKITINCIPSEQDAFQWSPGTCEISVSAHVCQALGLCSGSVVGADGSYSCQMTHDQFRDLNQCQAAGQHSATDAYRCCQLRHEYGHLCDPNLRGEDTMMCTEVYAENLDWQCMSNVVSQFCSGANSGTWPPQDCLDFCTRLLKRTATKVWDACMCANAVACSPISGAKCCACKDECKKPGRVWNALPPTCRSVLGSESNIFDSTIAPLCEGMPTGPHGCNYWNDSLPPDFQCPKATAVSAKTVDLY